MMQKIANGVDMVEIARFKDLDPNIRERFDHRVFTEAELSNAGGVVEHLAGKFAAKEAAAKALGCGIGDVRWQDLEILNEDNGQPILHLHEKAAAIAESSGWTSWSVSISHTAALAVAMVTALIDTKDP